MIDNINLCVLDSLETANAAKYTAQVVRTTLYDVRDEDFLNAIKGFAVSGCDRNGDYSIALTKEELSHGGELTIKVNESLFDIKTNKVGALSIRAY